MSGEHIVSRLNHDARRRCNQLYAASSNNYRWCPVDPESTCSLWETDNYPFLQ